MAVHAIPGHLIIAGLVLALASPSTGAQETSVPSQTGTERPPAQAAQATTDRSMDTARAARSAKLLAEFRAILDNSLAETAAAANPTPALSAGPSQPPAKPENEPSPAPVAKTVGGSPPAVLWPKDVQLDYTGFACEFFTRPPKADGSVDTHADGTWIAYGERMYQCVNRRWRLEGPVAAYAGGQERQARLIEH